MKGTFFLLDGLVEVQPFKKTSARSIVLCTFDCTDDILCKSFVFLKAKATENCLLSSDPNGGKSSEVSETFRVLEKSSVYDEAVVSKDNKRRLFTNIRGRLYESRIALSTG